MKKLLVYLFFLLLINISNAKAICDAKTQLEINTAASNVTADLYYEKKIVGPDGTVHPEIPDEVLEDIDKGYARSVFVTINIENITDNIYLTFENVDENIYETIYSSDVINGKYQYPVPDTSTIRTYTIKIYSNSENCFGEEIRNIEIKSPMYNFYSGTTFCIDNNAYYCQEFVTTPIDIDPWEISEKQNYELEDEEAENENGKKDIMIIYYIAIGCFLILIIYIIRKIMKAKKHKINI